MDLRILTDRYEVFFLHFVSVGAIILMNVIRNLLCLIGKSAQTDFSQNSSSTSDLVSLCTTSLHLNIEDTMLSVPILNFNIQYVTDLLMNADYTPCKSRID